MNQTSGEKKKKTTKTTKTSSSKKTTKSTKPTKTTKPSSSKTTKPRSKKGGNFLGSVGNLVAPTGWGSFATAAGLLALGGLDSTYRRSSKKEKTGKVKIMKGGLTDCSSPNKSVRIGDFKTFKFSEVVNNKNYDNYNRFVVNYDNQFKDNMLVSVQKSNIVTEQLFPFFLQIIITFSDGTNYTYCATNSFYKDKSEAINDLSNKKVLYHLAKIALLKYKENTIRNTTKIK